MTRAPGSPRWQRRIGFRLALMLALVLLGGYVLLPLVWNLSLAAFGLPTLDQEIIELSDPADARLLPLNDLRYASAYLLADARPDGAGRWIPDPGRAAAVERSLAAHGQTYAWLSVDREVLACSAALPFQVGDEFEQGLGYPDPDTLSRPFGDVTLGRIVTHVRKGGELAGWLVIYGEPPLGENLSMARVVVRAGGSERAWSNRVINLVASLGVLAVAMFLAWFASRLVTGRITRLAIAASAPIDDPRNLPGPFDESGGDEITVLAGALNRMRGKVQELLADLDRRDQDRRDWIAQVSHDLRTPLTALTACLDRAREEVESGSTDGLSERLDVARHDAVRLAELVEDLLDIARLDAEGAPVTEPVPPAELARQAAGGLTALAERSGVELELDLAPELPLLSADGRRLMRALENLLRNALHHARSKVVLCAAEKAGAVRFAVEDDGPGLPVGERGEVDIEALAERRSRPDSAGLGLVVVRKVAESHGGRMGAENADHGGARVWFEIPFGS